MLEDYTTDRTDTTHLSHREVNSDKKSHYVTMNHLLFPQKTTTPKPESSLFECVHRFCYFYILIFFPKNLKKFKHKNVKIIFQGIQLLPKHWLHGVAQYFTLVCL